MNVPVKVSVCVAVRVVSLRGGSYPFDVLNHPSSCVRSMRVGASPRSSAVHVDFTVELSKFVLLG
jgi:hypothetical protein